MRFSVIMSTYSSDNPIFLERAIKSITEFQTIKPDEIVFVVDGPIDEELNAIVLKYQQAYDFFHVIRLNENVGLGNVLRIALEKAKNELIARMDSDDISMPTRFEEQLQFFKERENLDIVGGDISEFVGDESNVVAFREVPKSDEEIKEYLKTRCPFNHMSVMFKKRAVLSAGGYQDLFWNEDYYLWIRMVENKAIMANTGTVLVNVRTGKDMYQRRGGKKYFESEKFLQKYMLDKKMINKSMYFSNVLKRWIVQRLLPNKIRGWFFRTFARKVK